MLSAEQQHIFLISQLFQTRKFHPQSDFHHSCAIQSKFRPQHQVSDDYSTSLHYFGLIF